MDVESTFMQEYSDLLEKKNSGQLHVVKKPQWNINMSLQSDNNKRIEKNTFLLYFRMLFMMVVSLYTSRVILNALGEEDFGIL